MLNKNKKGIEKTTFPQNSLNFYGKMALEIFFHVKDDEESIYRIRFWKKMGITSKMHFMLTKNPIFYKKLIRKYFHQKADIFLRQNVYFQKFSGHFWV